jgi:hypothetical protein
LPCCSSCQEIEGGEYGGFCVAGLTTAELKLNATPTPVMAPTAPAPPTPAPPTAWPTHEPVQASGKGWGACFTKRRPEFSADYFDTQLPVTAKQLSDAIASEATSNQLSTRDIIRAYNLTRTQFAQARYNNETNVETVPQPLPAIVDAYRNEIQTLRDEVLASRANPFFGKTETTKNFDCNGDIVLASGVTGDEHYLARLMGVVLNALAETTRNVDIVVYGLDDIRDEEGAAKFAHMKSALEDALLDSRAIKYMDRPNGGINPLPNMTLVPFPFHKYPTHVKTIGNYAFKPLVIHELSLKHKCVFWLDSSQEVLKLGQMVREIEEDGYWFAGGPAPFPSEYDFAYLNYWNVQATDYFGQHDGNVLVQTNWGPAPVYYRAGAAPGFVGFNKDSPVSQSVLTCWVACVTSKQCIDPKKFDFENQVRR